MFCAKILNDFKGELDCSMKRKIFLGDIFGCGINYQDYLIQDAIVGRDFLVTNASDADIIIFTSTCACTMSQITITINYMTKVLEQVKERDKVKVYLTGCLTRPFRLENDFFNGIKNWIDNNIDVVIPQNNPYLLLDMLYPNLEFGKFKNSFGYAIRYEDGTVDFYISNGCNNRCSFCKINYQTWPLKSMNIEKVKNCIDELNKCGPKIKRLVFHGANLAQFGYDIDGQYHLPEIIEYIEDKDNILSVLLSGFAVSDAVRLGFHEVLRDSDKFIGFGGSLESGSNRILRLMNKNITIEEYIDFIRCIKSKKEKQLYLSIIAGFPTETMKDVEMTLKALKEIAPTHVDICRYTDSPFIPSHNYEQLPSNIIDEHARIYSKVLQRRRVNSNVLL